MEENNLKSAIEALIFASEKPITLEQLKKVLGNLDALELKKIIEELKTEYCVVIVTHNMQQASRVSDYTGFMYLGELVEFGTTRQIFETPHETLTENYITGRFG